MLKRLELSDPTSCLNKAAPDELIFVILERDDAMPGTIRFWAAERVRLGLNKLEDAKIQSALRDAAALEARHAQATEGSNQ